MCIKYCTRSCILLHNRFKDLRLGRLRFSTITMVAIFRDPPDLFIVTNDTLLNYYFFHTVFNPKSQCSSTMCFFTQDFLFLDMHVQNKKYGDFVFTSRLTGKCTTQKLKKNFCSSSLWTCLHHYGHIKKPK